jgi:hypothetical protein
MQDVKELWRVVFGSVKIQYLSDVSYQLSAVRREAFPVMAF